MRILSIDGGGYLGLATVSLLEDLEYRFGKRCTDCFDLFCGTSTGAIIALALAHGCSASQVASLYQELGSTLFPPPGLLERVVPGLRQVRALVSPLYSNAPLVAALHSTFGDTTLGDLRKRSKLALVTAFNVSSGRPRIFKTDHAPELSAHDRYRLCDIALASSAAPKYFPLVELRDPISGVAERFCDGGVFANSPALLGYTECLFHLRVNAKRISLLSLSTPRTDLSERRSSMRSRQRSLRRGLWTWGERLASMLIDGNSQISHTVLERLASVGSSRYLRVTLTQPLGLGLDVATPSATETLRQLGTEHARTASLTAEVQSFFSKESYSG